jgi:predicted ATP-grasp superfamily ATP-dependent carboligase
MIQNRPALVFRGNDISYYGIISSLASHQLPYYSVLFDWKGSPTWHSSKSSLQGTTIVIPNPYEHPLNAAESLEKQLKVICGKIHSKLIAIPSSDTNLTFIVDYWEIFSSYLAVMGSPEFDDPRTDVLNKARCMHLLNSGSENLAPISFRCARQEDIAEIVNEVTYPAIYKPSTKDYGQSFYRSHNGSKAVECATPQKLLEALDNELKANFELVVQEKILFDNLEDEVPFYLYADKNHKIRMAATGKKNYVYPHPFGTALSLQLSWEPDLLDLANKVVKKINWTGILMIEFIRDKKDGRFKVVELNTRPWLFNGFYQLLGFNFVNLLMQDFNDQLKYPSDQLVFPDDRLLCRNPVHIDLIGILRALNIENIEYLRKWLSTQGNEQSFAYQYSQETNVFESVMYAASEVSKLSYEDIYSVTHLVHCDQ